MATFGSLGVVLLLALNQLTIGRWRFLHGGERSPWLSASAGTALAYVFVHLLPKLALSQQKLDGALWTGAYGFWRNHLYLVALVGLVMYYCLDTMARRSVQRRELGQQTRRGSLILVVGVYGLYYLQLGYLVADVPRPGIAAYLLIAAVLSVHLMGINHGLRDLQPARYDSLLRWLYAGALLCGWLVGAVTELRFATISILSAFIAGAIIYAALREELPAHASARLVPFVLGAAVTTLAILGLHSLQMRD
jgi:zinc transporter ZupT